MTGVGLWSKIVLLVREQTNSRWVPFDQKFRFTIVYQNFHVRNGTVFSSTPERSPAIPAWEHLPPIY